MMEQTKPIQLIDAERRTILCPRCEEEQPMRDFATLGMNPLYAKLLTTVFRCKLCNHLFAPLPVTLSELSPHRSGDNGRAG
jgi:hypothetical protein